MSYILVMTLVMFLFPTYAMQRNGYDERLDGSMDNPQKIPNSDSDSDSDSDLHRRDRGTKSFTRRQDLPLLDTLGRPHKRRNIHKQGSSSSACSSTDSGSLDLTEQVIVSRARYRMAEQRNAALTHKLEMMTQRAIRAQEDAQKSKLDLDELHAEKLKNDKVLEEACAEKHEIVIALKEVCATKEENDKALEEARAEKHEIAITLKEVCATKEENDKALEEARKFCAKSYQEVCATKEEKARALKEARVQIQEIKNQNVEQQKQRQQLQLEILIEAMQAQLEAEGALKNHIDQQKCIICCEEDATIAMIPCGHKVSCEQCAEDFTPKTPGHKKRGKPYKHECPICKENIKGKLKIFGSSNFI